MTNTTRAAAGDTISACAFVGAFTARVFYFRVIRGTACSFISVILLRGFVFIVTHGAWIVTDRVIRVDAALTAMLTQWR